MARPGLEPGTPRFPVSVLFRLSYLAVGARSLRLRALIPKVAGHARERVGSRLPSGLDRGKLPDSRRSRR